MAFEIRPVQRAVEHGVFVRARFGGCLAMGLLGRRGRGEWLWTDGLCVLVRWEGELLPYPSLLPGGGPSVVAVGLAAPGAAAIEERPGTPRVPNSVHWYAPLSIGTGGAIGGIKRELVRPRAADADGNDAGLLPGTPADIDVDILSGRLPLVQWTYTPAFAAAKPSEFLIFQAVPGDAFNLGAPIASVPYVAGQRRYTWSGSTPLAAGSAWCFTVVAMTAAGVRSLTPRYGASPSPIYDDAASERAALLVVPDAAPTAIVDQFIEEAR